LFPGVLVQTSKWLSIASLLLDPSVIHGDGTSTAAKKGGDNLERGGLHSSTAKARSRRYSTAAPPQRCANCVSRESSEQEMLAMGSPMLIEL
jgi:hypothetical protein